LDLKICKNVDFKVLDEVVALNFVLPLILPFWLVHKQDLFLTMISALCLKNEKFSHSKFETLI